MSKLIHTLKALSPWKRCAPRPKGRRQRPFVRPRFEVLEDRRVLAVVSFDGSGDGTTWQDPSNWAGDRGPTVADTAVIDGFDVVVAPVAIAAGARDLVVTNGTLTVNNTLGINGGTSVITQSASVTVNPGGSAGLGRDVDLRGSLTWNGGAIAGSFINHGLITLAGNNRGDGLVNFIDNHGAIIQTGTGYLGGILVNNLSGGLVDFRTDATDLGMGLTNEVGGIIRKSAGTGAVSFRGVTLRNEGGTIDVETGTIVLGGPNASFANTGGHFVVAGGAALELPHGTFSGTYTGSGAGVVRIVSGTASGEPFIDVVDGGTFDLPPGLLHWTRGRIRAIGGPLRNVGTLTLSGADRKYYGGDFFPLENSGTIIHTDTGVLDGVGVLNNSGRYQLRSDASSTGFFSAINNSGVFEKIGGSGTSQFVVAFNNAGNGLVDIRTGIMRMVRLTNDGTVRVAAGSALEVTGTGASSLHYAQNAAGTLELALNGTEWAQVRAIGSAFDARVNLAGTLILTETAPVPGTFVIIDNDRTEPVNGTFAGLPEGSIIVTARGTRYQISYRGGTGNDVTLTNVSPPNQPPLALDYTFTVTHDRVLTVLAPGLFGDNPDPDGDPVTLAVTSAAPHGIVIWHPQTGAFSYEPDPGFVGMDSFTYRLSDGLADSNSATVTITVTNQAPVALDYNFTIAQDQTLTVSAPGLIGNDPDPDSDPVTVAVTSAAPHGIVVWTPQTGAFSYEPDPGFVGVDSFTYRLNDGVADSNSATVTITLTGPTNQLPTANAGGPYTIAEGDSLALDASASFDPEGSDLDYAWDINGDGDFTDAFTVTPRLSWESLNDLGVVDGPSSFLVRVQVSDRVNDAVCSIETTLTVVNAPPVVAILGPTEGVRGQPLTFVIQAKDPSPVDQQAGFAFRIGWGDESDLLAVPATPNNGLGVVVQHVFTEVGAYDVKAEGVDRDLGLAGTTHSVSIVAVALQPDPCDPTQSALVVGGTVDDDELEFRALPGRILVRLNGAPLGVVARAAVSRVIAYGQAGNDTISSNLEVPSLFDGGRGNDELIGGRGADVLVGGPGRDRLFGEAVSSQTGRRAGGNPDVLIGGRGRDTLHGGLHSDLLIAGYTALDANAHALCAILEEWSSARSYEARVNNLRGTPNPRFPNRANGDFFLMAQGAAATVFDDDAADQLRGRAGRDWFFANVDRGVRDRLPGQGSDEDVDDIDLPILDDVYEENDARQQAYHLGAGGSFFNLVLADADWFGFTSQADARYGYSVRLVTSRIQGNLVLNVYDENWNSRLSLRGQNTNQLSFEVEIGYRSTTYFLEIVGDVTSTYNLEIRYSVI